MLDVNPDSTGNRFRRKRLEMLKALIEQAGPRDRKCRVLDVGGTYGFWYTWRESIDFTRLQVVCVNLDPSDADQGRGDIAIKMVKGDARDLAFAGDNEYDIVFSNSVIEHVGNWPDMMRMANEVRRVAPSYLVQTPYFWFPIEPHARTPFIHWLPDSLAYRIVMMKRCGYWKRQKTVSGAMSLIESAQLIDARQMAALFPDAEIVRERFLGMTKSLIALR